MVVKTTTARSWGTMNHHYNKRLLLLVRLMWNWGFRLPTWVCQSFNAENFWKANNILVLFPRKKFKSKKKHRLLFWHIILACQNFRWSHPGSLSQHLYQFPACSVPDCGTCSLILHRSGTVCDRMKPVPPQCNIKKIHTCASRTATG